MTRKGHSWLDIDGPDHKQCQDCGIECLVTYNSDNRRTVTWIRDGVTVSIGTTTPPCQPGSVRTVESETKTDVMYAVECDKKISLLETVDLAEARAYLRANPGVGHKHELVCYTSHITVMEVEAL